MWMTKGNIWEYHTKGNWVVIPTNIGWKKSNGENVMGRGIAKQCAEKFPHMPKLLGSYYKMGGRGLCWVKPSRLVFFPTKDLKCEKPWESWKGLSSPSLIRENLHKLNLEAPKTGFLAVPLLGCGNGGLQREDVLPMMHEILDNRFTLVELP